MKEENLNKNGDRLLSYMENRTIVIVFLFGIVGYKMGGEGGALVGAIIGYFVGENLQ